MQANDMLSNTVKLASKARAYDTQAGQAGVDPSMLRIDPQIGLIGTLLAYVAIVVGAVLDLRHKP